MNKQSVHQRKARDFMQREDWQNALSELQHVLDADAGNPTLHNQIGDVYLRAEEVEKACTHFERAIDLYAEVGLQNSAVALCKKVMRLRPERVEVRHRLARLRCEQGFRAESAQLFTDWLDHVHVPAGTDGEEFETRCREIVELLPEEAPVGKILEMLESAQRFACAFEVVRRLAQVAADAGDEGAERRYTEKMRSLRVLVERSGGRDLLASLPAEPRPVPLAEPEASPPMPESLPVPAPVPPPVPPPAPPPAPAVWSPEAPAAGLEDLIDSFREQMSRALDGDGAARYDLGVAYYDMGLYSEALAEFEAAARSRGLEVQSLEMMAACLLQQGRHRKIVELLVPALAADGRPARDRIGLQFSLGLAYEALGCGAEARRHFEEVALVDIDFKDVQVHLQRV